MKPTRSRSALAVFWLLLAGCSAGYDANQGTTTGNHNNNPGSGGNIAGSGAADFAAFRAALDANQIPSPETIDSTGFFAEHFTQLPAPACGQALCLHSMLAIAHNFVTGQSWTLVQLAMNTPIDPDTVQKAPLELAVVLDNSGSMEGDKLAYAKLGAQQLVDGLAAGDVLTVIKFSDAAQTIFGPAPVADKQAIKELIGAIVTEGGTNLHGGLDAGFAALESATPDETHLRRVIFLTDGQPTAGVTDPALIRAMARNHEKEHLGLTTIGLGLDADHALLRTLAEEAGGNYYFVAEPSAVTEVFRDELKFFTAPLAYDVSLRYDRVDGFGQGPVYGTSLWSATTTGGELTIPAVFVASRTSTAPNPDGERRGGGSALLIEMTRTAASPPVTAATAAANITLSYRLPGHPEVATQQAIVQYEPTPDATAYYSDPVVHKNVLILNFYVAFHDAATLATNGKRAEARQLLADFEGKITPELAGADEDLVDDLKLLQQFLGVLDQATP